jgi:SAM-dependent methyltransferase
MNSEQLIRETKLARGALALFAINYSLLTIRCFRLPCRMPSVPAAAIASHYLPSRYHYWYARSKIASDPLYAHVLSVAARTQAPLLDVGCGIGLLAQALRAAGVTVPYRGVDIDAQKIRIARNSVRKAGLSAVEFEICDLSRSFPDHRGSVALLDVVQYLDAAASDAVIDNAARSVSSDGILIMRAGLDDGSWRAGFTRMMDRVGHAIRWMQTPPRSQPTKSGLHDLLRRHGFRCEFHPAWGRTPFNNWMVVAGK